MTEKLAASTDTRLRNDPKLFEAFQHVPFLSVLHTEILRKIYQECILQGYSKGEFLFKEGEPFVYLIVVLSGRIKVVKNINQETETILGIASPGETMDESNIVDKSSYPTSGIAIEDVVVAKIHQCVFLKLLNEYPEMAFQIIRNLGERLKRFTEKITTMANLSVERRLARLLVNFIHEMGIPDSRGVLLNLPVTRNEIAEIVGTSTEVVIRVMQKMKKRGLLEVYGKRIIIRNVEKLKSI